MYKIFLLNFLSFFSVGTNREVLLHVNDFILFTDQWNEIKDIYENRQNKELTLIQLETLIHTYYILNGAIPEGSVASYLDEDIPPEIIEKKDILNILILLWNEERLTKLLEYFTYDNLDEFSIQNKDNNYCYEYLIITGDYKKTPPQISSFKDIIQSNRAPFLKKYEKNTNTKNLRLITIESGHSIKTKRIDKNKKQFFYVLKKAKIYFHTRYDIEVIIFNETENAQEVFTNIIGENNSMSIEKIKNILIEKKIKHNITKTSIHSQEDRNFTGVLSEFPVNTYKLIPNSQYVVFIIKKTRSPEYIKTKEERLLETRQNFLYNVLRIMNNGDLLTILKKWEQNIT